MCNTLKWIGWRYACEPLPAYARKVGSLVRGIAHACKRHCSFADNYIALARLREVDEEFGDVFAQILELLILAQYCGDVQDARGR